ncbi:MAG TPA: rhodanese-like domain-containing protein [Salinisphaeraceae bacterium]|nr:rhodanese-like domain-containing protein [Salinisphaeraceae bacterium]
MALTKSAQQLVAEANARITTLSLEQAQARHGVADAQFIDIRDVRELERAGRIPGAAHMPRGMLEFWADPDSPYYKPLFGEGKQLILYCASGWRSALATAALQDMGVPRVCHVEGGFSAWQKAGGAVEAYARKG